MENARENKARLGKCEQATLEKSEVLKEKEEAKVIESELWLEEDQAGKVQKDRERSNY